MGVGKRGSAFAAVAFCSYAALSTSGFAAASTAATIISIPGVAGIDGVSASGEYLIYQSGEVVNWLDTTTGTDIALANVGNGVQMSGDGQHVVFEDFGNGGNGTDPLDPSLEAGTVYEWTANGVGPGSYTQVSPTGVSYPGGGLMDEYAFPTVNYDGSVVVYSYRLATQTTCCTSGNSIWSSSSNTTIDVAASGTWFYPAVLSGGGSIFGRVDGGDGIDEYSVSDGSFVTSMTFGAQVSLWALSADGTAGVIFQVPAQSYAYFDITSGSEQLIPNTQNACSPSEGEISISSDGSTVAFGASSDGTVPDTSGLYNDYFLYDPTTQQVTNLTNGSAGASPGNGGICPSMALSSDGQDLIYTDYNPNGTVRSGAFTRSGRSDPELGTASGATNIEQLTIAPASTVTFNGNGGTGFMANETANAPTALTANTYTDVGHGFSGWNTAADGSGTAYANGATYAFNTSATLYAQWVQQVAQTITFCTVSSKTMIQSPVTVSATSSSGLPVSFKTTTTTVCTAGGTDGATITLLKTGTCTVQATQAGSASYKPAQAVNRSFTVSKAAQTITFGAPSNKTLAQSPVTVSATSSSGLAVTFTTTTPTVCTAVGTHGAALKLLKPGTCTVHATQVGSASYKPAKAVSRSFTVSRS